MTFTLGILGGMGPLASAEMVRSFYLYNLAVPEQESPQCLLHSIPSIADRTAVILARDEREEERVVRDLEAGIANLIRAGADRVVIACMTAHHFVDQLSAASRRTLVELPAVVVDELRKRQRPHLLLATLGTLRSRLLERHPGWQEVEPWVERLEVEQAEVLHDLLYELKKGRSPEPMLDWLRGLSQRTGHDSLIFGCTELHLLQPVVREDQRWDVLDPLESLASDPLGYGEAPDHAEAAAEGGARVSSSGSSRL